MTYNSCFVAVAVRNVLATHVCDLTHVYALQMCVDALQADRGAIKRRGKASHTGRYEA